MGSKLTYYHAVATAVLREARVKPGDDAGIHLHEVIQEKLSSMAEEYKEQNPDFNALRFRAEVLKLIAEELHNEIQRRGESDAEQT
tara:strand:- start:365 stop:622 length:258 start_codon:yes stop_codon:yes gene_type:complete